MGDLVPGLDLNVVFGYGGSVSLRLAVLKPALENSPLFK